ncbi:MAG: transposase [Thermomicrobiales bacterium]|nr:transposase [Thermomicrobiales bacterium]
MASRDWTATYRVFSAPRVAISALQRQVIAHWLRLYARHDPVVVVVDGTQLPRTGRKMPGSGWGRSPRTPPWKPGIHHAQRWEGTSGLTPPTAEGDSRAIPLVFAPAPSPTSRPWADHPPQTEWQAALEGVWIIREAMDALGEQDRPLVVTGDGAYSGAGTWNALPPATTGIARCAKNRALYHLPDPNEPPRRGRKRLYGDRGLTPQAQGQEHSGWQTCVIRVRGKDRHLRIQVTGPWVIKKAADHPLMLITIAGIGRGRGSSRRSRDMMHFLVNARQTSHGWELPYPVEQLALWVWQRWEVEVMHRELKSGWGLGDQQQWSARGAVTVTQWVVWVYAVLILTGVRCPPSIRHSRRWYRQRRWTPRDLTMQLREELMTAPPRQVTPHCAWFRTNPTENTALKVLLAVADAI